MTQKVTLPAKKIQSPRKISLLYKHGGVSASARFEDYLCVGSANFARHRWLYANYKHKNSPTLAPKFPNLLLNFRKIHHVTRDARLFLELILSKHGCLYLAPRREEQSGQSAAKLSTATDAFTRTTSVTFLSLCLCPSNTHAHCRTEMYRTNSGISED